MKALALALVAAITLLATACSVTINATYKKGPWEIGGTIKNAQQLQRIFIGLDTQDIDAAKFAIDTSGTSLSLPSTGVATLNLVSASTQAIRISKQFAWVRNGTTIVLQNPSAANSWLQTYALPDDSLTYSINNLPDTTVEGWNAIEVASAYDGTETARYEREFIRDWRNCRPVACHEP